MIAWYYPAEQVIVIRVLGKNYWTSNFEQPRPLWFHP